ncbi:MAG TPA: tRNA adenosine(34) deaminase TadA [Pyrinomonadaceae bacterium]|nr:tRNA adenosine(34) deaminase TadA [Pyrinomonadaceae bacterium]
MEERDTEFMGIALEQARAAGNIGEVPVGSCIVDAGGSIVATGFNRTIVDNDPTAHAEIIALRSAAASLGNYRLIGTTIYSTIEPCVMCAGALVNARVKRLVFGATDARYGAAGSVFNLCDTPLLNHEVEITSGIRVEECRELMQTFFKARR